MFLVIIAILLIPLIAMQFSQEVQWSVSDFIIMGAVLTGVALAYEFVSRRSEKTLYRIAVGVGLAGAFLLFWVNGAVGIIGNENQPANLLYGSVYVVGFFGALLSRFKARGMYLTLLFTALVQMLVPVLALIIWPPPATSWSPGVFQVFYLNAFFAGIFGLSAVLFRMAAQDTSTDEVG